MATVGDAIKRQIQDAQDRAGWARPDTQDGVLEIAGAVVDLARTVQILATRCIELERRLDELAGGTPVTGPAADGSDVVYDARLGATSMPYPDAEGHVAWIAGLGYRLDDLPLLTAFLQRAHQTASEAAAHRKARP